MRVYYLDASAWIKRHVQEAGTEWISRFWELGRPTACSVLGLLEVLATLVRRQADGGVSEELTGRTPRAVERDFDGFHSIQLHEPVMAIARQVVRQFALRAADGIHLASAMWLRQMGNVPVVVIASDRELLRAASAAGFEAIDPQTNPPGLEILEPTPGAQEP